MSRFEECLSFVLEAEGGYVKNKNDPGGATNKGITQLTYDTYRRSVGRLPQPVMLITEKEVSDIYRMDYWNRTKCDILNSPIDLIIFDAAVNCGPKQASIFLQRSLGVDPDGIIGNKTIEAFDNDIKSGMLDELVNNLIEQRRSYYKSICQSKPGLVVFLNGWMNRINALEKECKQ